MNARTGNPLLGLRITSLGLLLSRVLGMVRDAATASLLGMSSTGVMDALVVAFRIPDLFRRFFGEGILTATYIPQLTRALERERASGLRLITASAVAVTCAGLALVMVGELLLVVTACFGELSASQRLTLELTALLLPYVCMVSLVAQLVGSLHSLGHFTVPSMVTTVLNLCWLGAVSSASWVSTEPERQAVWISLAVLVAGLLQIGLLLGTLRGLGVRWQPEWVSALPAVRDMGRTLLPAAVGLATTQLNTAVDGLVAWAYSAAPGSVAGGQDWLSPGAAAATYYGERLYMFPLGLLGIPIATVLFPRLSRLAAQGRLDRLASNLTLGLRLILFLAVPAGVGLIIFSVPITQLLFERGAFVEADTQRTAEVIAGYGLGVAAYCALPLIIRAIHISGDLRVAARVGVASVLLNLVLNLSIAWRWREAGLAAATASCALGQLVYLVIVLMRRLKGLPLRPLAVTMLRTGAATMVMSGAASWALHRWCQTRHTGELLLGLAASIALSIAAYLATSWALRAPELKEWWEGLMERAAVLG